MLSLLALSYFFRKITYPSYFYYLKVELYIKGLINLNIISFWLSVSLPFQPAQHLSIGSFSEHNELPSCSASIFFPLIPNHSLNISISHSADRLQDTPSSLFSPSYSAECCLSPHQCPSEPPRTSAGPPSSCSPQ